MTETEREIWYAIPTCNVPRAQATLKKWKEKGYKTIALLDGKVEDHAAVGADVVLFRDKYEGYYVSARLMAQKLREKLGDYPDIMVCGGDDMDPDPKLHAQAIAAQCYEKFPDGYFVMQPIGDDLQGTDKICGSPWFGKEWLKRSYNGNGPFCGQYFQFYGDEELRYVADIRKVLWQRPDLAQRHHHWLRPGIKKEKYQSVNEVKYWEKDKATFAGRQTKGFPGSYRQCTFPAGAKVVVTGAGGFIGHHLSNRLVAEGADVFSIDRKHPEWGDHPSRDFMLVDLRCIEDFLSGQDFVFHLAAEMGGIGYIENNKGDIVSSSTRIDLNVLDASYRSKVGRFLYTSSACVYPGYRQNDLNNPGLRESDAYPADAEDGYGWQKLYTERLCRHYRKDFGLDTRIARLHNIFGPLGTYDGGREKAPAAMCRKIAMAKDGDPIEVWGDGKQTRSYCYVDDCVEGLIRLMLFDYNKPINIGTDEMVSVNKLIEHVEAVSGKKVKRVYDQTKPKGVRGRNANLDLVKVVLDWSPTRTLKEGLAETYPWIAEQVQK